MPQTRQLAAIMFTDIVGYTALMGKDEQRAFEILIKNRELQKPIIEKYKGRWIKEIGDGVMASFSTVSDAVYAAQEIQQQCKKSGEFLLRIGIHHGEIVFDVDDVFGDAVNIASRIQAIAPVGGICISESVHHNVVNKKDISTKFVKSEKLKNVSEPIRIYEITRNTSDTLPHKKSKAIGETIRKVSVRQLAIALIVVAVLAGIAFFLSKGKALFANSAIESIAVLPFVNQTGNTDMEYLSDGMTETLINSLSRIGDLSVKARSSVFRYKGKDVDPQKAGSELSVQAILNGRVAQRQENIVLILELVDVKTGDLIWGENYNRKTTDLVTLQSEIVGDVSKKLQQKLTGVTGQNIANKYTTNSEAYRLYLRGLFHWNKRTADDLKKAIDYFNQSKEKDPSFALAYAGLAVTYAVLPSNTVMSKAEAREASLKAKAAALKALEIDENLAEAHAVLAGRKTDEWDFAGAEKDYKRAIELNPNYAPAHLWYSVLLSRLGRHDEARAEIKKAHELDPFSPVVNMNLGLSYVSTKQYNDAINQLKTTIELAPDYSNAYYFLGMLYFETGKYEESLSMISKAVVLMKYETPASSARKTSELRQALKTGGKKGYWRKLLEYELKSYENGIPNPVFIAGLYSSLGETEKAFEWLEKAYKEHDFQLTFLKLDLAFDNLRSDPRFKDLLRRIGLPAE